MVSLAVLHGEGEDGRPEEQRTDGGQVGVAAEGAVDASRRLPVLLPQPCCFSFLCFPQSRHSPILRRLPAARQSITAFSPLPFPSAFKPNERRLDD